MQSSLQKLINKPNKRRCNSIAGPSSLEMPEVYPLTASYCDSRHTHGGSDQQHKLKQPLLLSRLAQSSSEQSAAPISSQKHPAASTTGHQIPESGQRYGTSSIVKASDQQTGLCPVCGLELPSQLLQEHVEEELSLLTNSNDDCMDPAFAVSRKEPSGLTSNPAPVTKLRRYRPAVSRQHPADQQKVSAACCIPRQGALPLCVTIRHLPSGISHPSAIFDFATQ